MTYPLALKGRFRKRLTPSAIFYFHHLRVAGKYSNLIGGCKAPAK